MQKLFNKIVVPIDFSSMSYMMDRAYTPALYKLYQYYYYRDVAKADKFLKAYLRNADPSPKACIYACRPILCFGEISVSYRCR